MLTKNSPELTKNTNAQIQEAQQATRKETQTQMHHGETAGYNNKEKILQERKEVLYKKEWLD